MLLNDKQRQIGKDNFAEAVKISRRQFVTGAVAVPTAAAMYWGYGKLDGKPVRAAIIGTGDQACNAHISQSNPDYIEYVAYSEIRPSNQKRARKLFNDKYGAAAKNIKLYEDYKQLLADKDVELVIVALPLFLHAPVTIEALNAGKHVLCEKLMAKTVLECKQMIRAADQTGNLLAIGHQRHYSYLYANAHAIIEQGDILGDIQHIRAYWHRNQTAGGAPDSRTGKFDSWAKPIPGEDEAVDCKKWGYNSIEELVRWRIYDRTGAGLMAELGSHQLDAASIFLGKKHPVAVQGSGKTSYFTDGRQVEDHIFLTFEFGKDANNAVVTYSSICTNAFDGYGEQVMGTRGTMIVQEEKDAYVFREAPGLMSKDTRVTWAEQRMDRPATQSGSTKQWASGVDVADTLTSRGYREEQEHLAFLIRHPELYKNPDPAKRELPRCDGRVALADAVVALCANMSMRKNKRVEFKKEWFEAESDSVPETEV